MVKSDRALNYREKAACEPEAQNFLQSLDLTFSCQLLVGLGLKF